MWHRTNVSFCLRLPLRAETFYVSLLQVVSIGLIDSYGLCSPGTVSVVVGETIVIFPLQSMHGIRLERVNKDYYNRFTIYPGCK